jgi:hypothetical protein
MLLSGALFALFMMGFWLYCLTDAILTPASECRGLSKPVWIAVIVLTFVGGAVAWLIAREPLRSSTYGSPASAPRWDPDALGDAGDLGHGYFRDERWTAADDAVARHPAGRGRPLGTGQVMPRGPDDDQEFLRALGRAIRRNSQASGDLRTGSGGRAPQPATPEYECSPAMNTCTTMMLKIRLVKPSSCT